MSPNGCLPVRRNAEAGPDQRRSPACLDHSSQHAQESRAEKPRACSFRRNAQAVTSAQGQTDRALHRGATIVPDASRAAIYACLHPHMQSKSLMAMKPYELEPFGAIARSLLCLNPSDQRSHDQQTQIAMNVLSPEDQDGVGQ